MVGGPYKICIDGEWAGVIRCLDATCKVKVPPLVGTRYEPSGKSVFSPGERVRVICAEKYFIFNRQTASAEILCNDMGSWEHRPLCEEITCSRPDSQLLDYWGGGWYLKRAGDTATYRCISGYKSTNGVDRATCARDGWTPNPLCQEITCMTQDYPNAIIGGIIKPVYKYNDQVRYICKSDHTRYFTQTCTDKGLWRGSVHCPDIGCSKPVIKDVDIIENDRRERYSHGERVACRCSHGARETFTVTCDQGEWTGIKSCSGCGELSVEHGFGVHPNATVPLAYYTCDEGYKLFTKGWWAEAKCNDGEWSKLDQCIEQSQCGEEPVIPNGKAIRRETRQGPVQTLQITCDAGYSASIAQLRCQEGQWNLELPPEEICKHNPDLCGPPPKVENAVVSTPYQKEYLSTSEVTYQCCDQHRIQGEDTIRCRDGEWERKDIKCIPFCGKLKDKMKTMTFSKSKERYVTGEVINYRCVVPEPIARGTAICESGTWIKTVECKVKPCPTPNNINGGRHAIIKGEGYVYGTAVKYTCNEGYRMEGQHTLKCTLDGWDKIEPRCERVTCQVGSITPGFAAPRIGEIVTAGESLVFSCRDNYDLEGDGEVECLGTGEWSGPFPTCCKKCQVQNVPSTVNYTPRVQTLSKGETLTFSCKNQQHLIQGSSTVECLENGEWSKTFPSCGASSYCGRPPPLEGGDTEEATRDQYNRYDRVKYVCQSFYTMEGGPYKTCINGEWTGDIRCLKPCTVDQDAMTGRNIRFKYTHQNKLYLTHNDEVQFMCTRGRHVGGVGMRPRCLNGVIELPTCE
ncbi:complement factor H-like isoform X2 [Mugil cephalus]|uniref:complement factor H-like isoform X2 n=1 Tax=Mugil cephalus TaxID=48193 RepID=UPI001FB836A6|nr:complement factor H-like isoform X2 [Mugil cephalus]